MSDSRGRPLRKVKAWDSHGQHLLDCGHRVWFRYTAFGPTFPKKARCDECAQRKGGN